MFVSHLDFNLFRFRLPIMKRLVELGNEVIAFCPPGEYAGRFEKNSIQYIPWNLNRQNKNPFTEVAYIYQLAQTIREIRPALVHSFTIRPNLYTCFASYFISKKANIVCSVTGLGSLYLNTSSIKFRLSALMADCAYALAFHHAHYVVFQNTDNQSQFLSRRLIPESKSILIKGSGVNTQTFSPTGGGGENKPVKVLLVARLIREKGVMEFCEAAKALKAKYSDEVVFLLVGWFDQGNPSCIDRGEIEYYTQAGCVSVYEGVDDPAPFYADSDIYCLPSYGEGMPMTVLEAMASGLPIVTTDAPGCRETVDEGVNGYLVQPRDVGQLVERLSRLIEDRLLRERMGTVSRQMAENQFSLDLVIERHLQLYQSTLVER